jgi:hypothetical protein
MGTGTWLLRISVKSARAGLYAIEPISNVTVHLDKHLHANTAGILEL